MKARIAAFTPVFLALAAGPIFPALPADSRNASVDRLFSEFAKPASPGCAVGISRNGKIIYRQAYGMADLERDVALTPGSVFHVGSIAKQFTAGSVVLLAQRGKLKLTDSVRTYVPELPAYYEPVTIHHLIHHTSGMRDEAALISLIHDGLGQPHVSPLEAEGHDGLGDFHMSDEEFLQLMARQKSLEFAPGSRDQYSNSGYILLSIIVSRVSGESLREFARENIFDPLGMKSTEYVDDHAQIIRRRAIGYFPRRNGGFFIDSAPLDLVGDGGLYSTVDDLLRWVRNFDTGQVGGWAFRKAMLTPGKLEDGKSLDYAAGLVIGSYRGLGTVSHPGGEHAYAADLIWFPDERFAVACLCSTRSQPEDLTRQIATLYLGDKMKADTAAAGAGAFHRPSAIEREAGELSEYAGDYHTDELPATFRLLVKGGQLQLFGRRSNDPVLYPIGVDRFFFKPGMDVVFTRDAHQRIAGFTIAFRGAEWDGPAPSGPAFVRSASPT